MVMLADTDVGSIVTAAQSGAVWGLHLLLPEILLIPVLYMVQEVTVRLGIYTQRGHGELIREHFGKNWALLSVGTLFLSAVGALVTEFAGIASVGSLFHIAPLYSVGLATILLVLLGLTGSYQKVEWIGIFFGLFELLFIPIALMTRPTIHLTWNHLQMPMHNPSYLTLLAANIGAVIMPWMVFYQQNAVIDKGLRHEALHSARIDTWFGAILTQLVMIAVLITMWSTVSQLGPHTPMTHIHQIADALGQIVGQTWALILFGGGVLGAGFVASLVVSTAGAWGITEALNMPHSLSHKPHEAKLFYSIYSLAHLGGALIVLSGLPLMNLTIGIEEMNAILLPIVLGFLLLLERKALPDMYRMHGLYRQLVWVASAIVSLFGLYIAASLFV